MKEIYNIDSDASLFEELSNGIRLRSIEQKFIYQGEGAKIYYQDKSSNPVYIGETLVNSDFNNFVNNNIDLKNKISLISLGCGNSETEKYLYNNSNFSNVDYFGVDASKAMLDLSIENLQDVKSDKKFICSDFTKRAFRLELREMTKKYNERIFAFFSNTFGNIQHTNIIDILSNLLNKGDKIWLDVRLRKGTTIKDDFEIVNIIAKDIERDETTLNYTRTFREIGMDVSKGELKMSSKKESSINALKCDFSFQINEKTKVSIKGDDITILPGESINLLRIYVYDPDGLINFFEEHGFNLIDKQIKGYRGQFLFEKK
ncbi:MAG: L-histidine N(alpha)-methyltransferase [Candidatus Gracilibacteria bacterium]|nr:L-histidine N(alpha)-methyltransferase [Candidatus Gracilibacteria bacterium]